MISKRDLSVLHIGPGKYQPFDRSHVTYEIWSELAAGFRDYHVIARSVNAPAEWCDGNLRITLLPSRTEREAEFLISQFKSVPVAVRHKPDVIVCQSPPLGGLAAIIIARLTGAKILMELHGAEYFVRARFASRMWILQRLTKFAIGRSDRIRVVSQGMRLRLLDGYGGALDGRISIVSPRVNLARFDCTRVNNVAGPLRLAMVGAVNNNKGQLRLIQALEAAPFELELRIAGEGPDLAECRERATSLAKTHSALRVICEGFLPPDGVAALLRSCDILIIYSRSEGTPRAAMEAMAAGVPVITTDAGFCVDIVADGVEGFVLGNDSDREIVNVLTMLNSDRRLLARMGAAARQRARRDFDSIRLFDDYRKLIADTAAR